MRTISVLLVSSLFACGTERMASTPGDRDVGASAPDAGSGRTDAGPRDGGEVTDGGDPHRDGGDVPRDGGDPGGCVPLPATPITEVADAAFGIRGLVEVDGGFLVAWIRNRSMEPFNAIVTHVDAQLNRVSYGEDLGPLPDRDGQLLPAEDGAWFQGVRPSLGMQRIELTKLGPSGSIEGRHTITSTTIVGSDFVRTDDGYAVSYNVGRRGHPYDRAVLQRLDTDGRPVGDPVTLIEGRGVDQLVWTGSQLGAVVLSGGTEFGLVRLDANGTTPEPVMPLVFDEAVAGPFSLAAHPDGFLFGTRLQGDERSLFRFFDAAGAPVGRAQLFGLWPVEAVYDGEVFGLAAEDFFSRGTAMQFAVAAPGQIRDVRESALSINPTNPAAANAQIVAVDGGFVLAWLEWTFNVNPLTEPDYRVVMARVCL
ncbi:MAG: hypothetical protein RMA76_45845 [Deltaproteobacteria bacterium]|jgi:hypothetical protein